MDGVHVKFSACPAEMSASCTGKEKVPTVGWNVTVSHTMRILYVGDAQLGAVNDKTHARRDELLKKLKKDDEPFVVQSASGACVVLRGRYVICDGGYHLWTCSMSPSKWTPDDNERLFFKHLESTRKDVECTFGVLKKRWRILHVGPTCSSLAGMDDVFRACAILHNMILEDSGVMFGADECDLIDAEWRGIARLAELAGELPVTPIGVAGHLGVGSEEDEADVDDTFSGRRDALREHFVLGLGGWKTIQIGARATH